MSKAYYQAHRAECLARSAQYNKDHREERNTRLRKWLKANPEKRFMRMFRYRLKKKYGLTVADYYWLLAIQDNKCAICEQPLKKTSTAELRHQRDGQSTVIDHDHATKQTRGLVHNDCNRALGLMKDNPQYLKFAAQYLELRSQ